MGEGEGSSAETQANDLSGWQKKNCGGATGEVGEGESCEEGCLAELRLGAGGCCGRR